MDTFICIIIVVILWQVIGDSGAKLWLKAMLKLSVIMVILYCKATGRVIPSSKVEIPREWDGELEIEEQGK